jgi:pimeloyl-ACP methyl ester carboxylesterase
MGIKAVQSCATVDRIVGRGVSLMRMYSITRIAARSIALPLCMAMMAFACGAVRASTATVDASCTTAAPADASLQQSVVTVPGGRLAYYRFGHGRPLLLITGYRATVSEWNAAFLDALAKDREVIVLENPGVGASQFASVPDSMAGLATAVSAFIDALHLHRVDVVGWSMGGMIAQQLALDHPQQVASLVLLSTTPPGRGAVPVSSTVNTVLSGHAPSPFEAIMGALFPPDAQAQAIRCFRSEMFTPKDYARAHVDDSVAQAQSRAMSAWWSDDKAAAALAQLQTPTLVIAGAKDAVLSPRNAQVLQQTLPHASLYEPEDGGHAYMYQQPTSLAARITRFLDRRKQVASASH